MSRDIFARRSVRSNRSSYPLLTLEQDGGDDALAGPWMISGSWDWDPSRGDFFWNQAAQQPYRQGGSMMDYGVVPPKPYVDPAASRTAVMTYQMQQADITAKSKLAQAQVDQAAAESRERLAAMQATMTRLYGLYSPGTSAAQSAMVAAVTKAFGTSTPSASQVMGTAPVTVKVLTNEQQAQKAVILRQKLGKLARRQALTSAGLALDMGGDGWDDPLACFDGPRRGLRLSSLGVGDVEEYDSLCQYYGYEYDAQLEGFFKSIGNFFSGAAGAVGGFLNRVTTIKVGGKSYHVGKQLGKVGKYIAAGTIGAFMPAKTRARVFNLSAKENKQLEVTGKVMRGVATAVAVTALVILAGPAGIAGAGFVVPAVKGFFASHPQVATAIVKQGSQIIVNKLAANGDIQQSAYNISDLPVEAQSLPEGVVMPYDPNMDPGYGGMNMSPRAAGSDTMDPLVDSLNPGTDVPPASPAIPQAAVLVGLGLVALFMLSKRRT